MKEKILKLIQKMRVCLEGIRIRLESFYDESMTKGFVRRSQPRVPGRSSLFPQTRGFFFILSFGRWVRPVSKFPGHPEYNPWKCKEDVWFVFRARIPLPGLFVSFVTKGGHGGYIGVKPYDVDPEEELVWADKADVGRRYFCPSFSVRHVKPTGE